MKYDGQWDKSVSWTSQKEVICVPAVSKTAAWNKSLSTFRVRDVSPSATVGFCLRRFLVKSLCSVSQADVPNLLTWNKSICCWLNRVTISWTVWQSFQILSGTLESFWVLMQICLYHFSFSFGLVDWDRPSDKPLILNAGEKNRRWMHGLYLILIFFIIKIMQLNAEWPYILKKKVNVFGSCSFAKGKINTLKYFV